MSSNEGPFRCEQTTWASRIRDKVVFITIAVKKRPLLHRLDIHSSFLFLSFSFALIFFLSVSRFCLSRTTSISIYTHTPTHALLDHSLLALFLSLTHTLSLFLAYYRAAQHIFRDAPRTIKRPAAVVSLP